MLRKDTEHPKRQSPDRHLAEMMPDPLEGVVPGENRHERYVYFMDSVVGHIWPPSRLSGQHTEYSEYVWGLSELAAGNTAGYIQFSPRAVDPRELTDKAFEQMTQFVGPEYPRIRAVDPQVAEPGFSGINVGGSCIMETRMMRTATELYKAGLRAELREFARSAIEMAPTITHVSGVQSPAVEYDESDMWIQRIHGDYGIPIEEAQRMVTAAYARINSAILHKARLAYNDPQREMVVVNFDELDLEGEKQRWFENLRLKYNPQLRIFDVISTYVGPEVKNQLNTVLQRKLQNDELNPAQRAIAEAAINSVHHVRVKQVDHGSFESLPLPIGYIMGKEALTEDQRLKMQEDEIFRNAVTLLKDLHDRHTQQPTQQQGLYIGFADFPANGATVAHKERWAGGQFTGNPGTPEHTASVEAALANPAYLHRGNVEEHLTFLHRYTQDENDARTALIARKKQVEAQLQPKTLRLKELGVDLKKAEQNMTKYHATKEKHLAMVQALQTLLTKDSSIVTERKLAAVDLLKNNVNKALASFDRRQDQLNSGDPRDLKDQGELAKFVDFLSHQVALGKPMPELPTSLTERAEALTQEAQHAINMCEGQMKITTERQQMLKEELLEIEANPDVKDLRKKQSSLEHALQQLKKGPFPLVDNPFVQHAMNFLFDPDFAAYLVKATEIDQTLSMRREGIAKRHEELLTQLGETSRRDNPELEALKNQDVEARRQAKDQMRELSAKLYPKLEAYIRYIFDESDTVAFPTALRNSRLIA